MADLVEKALEQCQAGLGKGRAILELDKQVFCHAAEFPDRREEAVDALFNKLVSGEQSSWHAKNSEGT